MALKQPSSAGRNLRTRLWTFLPAIVGLILNLSVLSFAQDKICPIVAPFEMSQLRRPEIPLRHFDIRDFGAQEGGLVKNTRAIQTAIKKAAEAGGGIVVIPEGKWLTGAIRLDNNINLCLSKGAELLFSQDFNDYLPVVFSRHEDVECYKHSAFVYVEGKSNVAITGEGVLNGQGKPWWNLKEKNIEKLLYEMGNKGVSVKERIFDGKDGRQLRPAFFQPMNCKNVLVEGVTFLYGAFWTVTPTYCENVIVRKVHIVTEGDYGHTPNGDGVDPSSCKNVLIEDCEFDTGDDCIAIKAGRDQDGLRVGKPTESVVVRNCRGLRGHGGIVIGSETSGGVRNVYAVNCQFNGTDRIVRIKTARGRGGVIENMWFKDLSGEEILREAIHLNMLYTGDRLPSAPVTETTPRIRNIHLENIRVSSGKSYAVELLGLPEMLIENVTLDGIVADAVRGINLSDVKGIQIKNSSIKAETFPVIRITDGEGIMLDSMRFPNQTDQLLRVDGARSADIKIRKTNIPNVRQAISLGSDVSKQAVLIEE
jgi:hypothetical protein